MSSLPPPARVPRVIALVACAAAVTFFIQALAWPLRDGRTTQLELLYYLDFWSADPFSPGFMARVPVTGFLFGSLLNHTGALGTELVLGLCFVATVCSIYLIGMTWGSWIAVTAAGATLLHGYYGSLFHTIDSDGLFAAALAIWIAYAIRYASVHTWRVYLVHGLFVFLLIMIRPANQGFLAFAVYPLLRSPHPIGRRVAHATVFVGTAVALVSGWATVNFIRFGEPSLSRFGNAAPLYRIMMSDDIVRPENGPASAAVGEAVQRELLTEEPYRSRGVTLQQFFFEGGSRAWEDLLWLSDTHWGWNSKYRILRDVAYEAIRREPGQFVLSVQKTLVHTFIMKYDVPAVRPVTDALPEPAANRPADGALIPRARIPMMLTTPDRRYENGGGRERLSALMERYQDFARRALPGRRDVAALGAALNALGRLFTPMILVLAAAILGLPFLGVRDTTKDADTVLALMFLMSLLLMAMTCALQPATIQYRLPLDPLFMLTALVGGSALVRGRRQLARDNAGAESRD